ncbi:hypothetical protein C8R45DRAFT_987951 [Mycena sanguinolenta]|nr:hypothetical protein C8R45DRAFT_987951 [Mycena sanguinolenta]
MGGWLTLIASFSFSAVTVSHSLVGRSKRRLAPFPRGSPRVEAGVGERRWIRRGEGERSCRGRKWEVSGGRVRGVVIIAWISCVQRQARDVDE